MSVVVDFKEWVRDFEVDLYSFSYVFAAGFKLSQSISLKRSFLLPIYSIIKHKNHDFLSGEKRRSDINFPAEEEMDRKSRGMSRRRLVLLETKKSFGTQTQIKGNAGPWKLPSGSQKGMKPKRSEQ